MPALILFLLGGLTITLLHFIEGEKVVIAKCNGIFVSHLIKTKMRVALTEKNGGKINTLLDYLIVIHYSQV